MIVGIIYGILLSPAHVQNSDRPIIIIDPGHGRPDAGATGVNGVLEKDIVLSIAKKVDSLNPHLHNNQFDIYLTRYHDTLISLSDRTKLAKRLNADFFISLHCNQAVNKKAKGIELYVNEKPKRYSKSSVRLASTIQKKLNGMLGFKNRGIISANLQVPRETTDSCPAVLLEIGFYLIVMKQGTNLWINHIR